MNKQRVIRILVPRNNMRDALPVERMLAAMAGDFAFALEVLAQKNALHFQIRGEHDAVEHVLSQLSRAYPQCDFEECDDGRQTMDDTAHGSGRLSSRLSCDSRTVCRQIELRLREAAYLPIYTHVSREGRVENRDFQQGADPLVGVLAAMDGLQEGESCLWQVALKPMPPDWSKYWRGAALDVNERGKFTPAVIAGAILLPFGLMLMVFGFAYSALSIFTRTWSQLMPGLFVLLMGLLMIYGRFRLASAPDPVLVKQKINSSGFRARIRVFVSAQSSQRLDARMRRIHAAIASYNLAGGNGFKVIELAPTARVDQVYLPPASVIQRLPFVGFMRRPWHDLPILNTAEVAMLWHLPHAEAQLQGLATTTAKQLLPVATNVQDGILVGQARTQGHRIPVRLSPEILRGNIGLIAKTQSGKSNLMALITSEIIATEPDASVIVLDPHRRLAETIAGLIPSARQKDAIYLTLANRERPFALNLLHRLPASKRLSYLASATEKFADKMTSDIIGTFTEIWPDNWGPRMESFLRWSLLTLGHANEIMSADHNYVAWREEWLLTAITLTQSIMRSEFTQVDERMLVQSIHDFNQLQAPPLGEIGKEYEQYKAIFAELVVLMNARRLGDRAKSISLSTKLKELNKLVRESLANQHKPSGISRRCYGKDGLPLQFTLLDVGPLQLHAEFRRSVLGALPGIPFQHIQAWWDDSFGVYDDMSPRMLLEMIQPVLSKMDRFAASDIARRIFGQPDSTLDLADIMNNGKILLLDLAAGIVGQDTAALVGSTIMNWLASLLFARQEMDTREPTQARRHRPVYIVIDEFQSIPGADYAFILSELAKYGAQLMMGTQSLLFLNEVNRKARTNWLSNTNTLFVFRCGSEDAEVLARELAITATHPLTLEPSDIVGLPDFNCYVRARDPQGRQQVFSLETNKVRNPDSALAAQLLAKSHQDFGKDANDVDTWLAEAQKWRGKADFARSKSNGWHGNEATPKHRTARKPAKDTEQSADYVRRTRERSGKAKPMGVSEDQQPEL